MNKNKKRILRTIICVLIFALLFSLTAPIIYATPTEPNESGASDEPSTNMNSTDPTESTKPTESISEEPQNNNVQEQPVESPIDGFNYSMEDGLLTITRAEGSEQPAIILDGTPSQGFDRDSITVFIGDLESRNVTQVTLSKKTGFVSCLDLKDGYYVIYSGGYAWEDAESNAFVIDGDKYRYIYIGQNYDDTIYPINFEVIEDRFIHLSLDTATPNNKIIKYGEQFVPQPSDSVYPAEAIVKGKSDFTEENQNEQYKPENNSSNENSKNSDVGSIFKAFTNSLSKSIILIVLAITCYVSLVIIKRKKQRKSEEQSENDKFDDKYVL